MFNILIFKASPLPPEISLFSASSFIHDGTTNFRALVYDFILLSSLRKFEFCIHVLANMPVPDPLGAIFQNP